MDINSFYTTLTGMESDIVTVQALAKSVAYFDGKVEYQFSNGEAQLTLDAYAEGNGHKILAFRVNELDEQEAATLSVNLGNGIAPDVVRGDFYVFDLGEGTINDEYTLTLSNIQLDSERKYIVECDIRVIEDEDLLYSLAGETEDNHRDVIIDVFPFTRTILYADLNNPSARVIKSSTNKLEFVMTTNQSALDGLHADLYKKNGTGYSLLDDNLPIGADGKTANVTWPANLDEGTYRIVFRLNEAKCNYNIIVSDK